MISVNTIFFIFICIFAVIGALVALWFLVQLLYLIVVGIICLVSELIDKIKYRK